MGKMNGMGNEQCVGARIIITARLTADSIVSTQCT